VQLITSKLGLTGNNHNKREKTEEGVVIVSATGSILSIVIILASTGSSSFHCN
jgi:hypothetical protein